MGQVAADQTGRFSGAKGTLRGQRLPYPEFDYKPFKNKIFVAGSSSRHGNVKKGLENQISTCFRILTVDDKLTT